MQETAIKALAAGLQSDLSWWHQVMRSCYVDQLRKVNQLTRYSYLRGKQAAKIESLDRFEEAEFLDTARPVEDQVDEERLMERVCHALFHLTPRQRRVLILHYFLGLTDQEVMAKTGYTRGSMHGKAFKVVRRVRALCAA